jgi:acyl-CoA thioesterase-1
MKKINYPPLRLFSIIGIVLLFFVILGCNNDYHTRPIVCLGDSLTEGYGATTTGSVDKTKSYPAFLQSKVKSTVVNAGVSGGTSAQGRFRMNDDVLAKNPKIVIVELGANDFFRQRPVNDTKADLQAIITALKSGDRKIYLASFLGYEGMKDSFKTVCMTNTGINMTADKFEELFSDYKAMFSTLQSENSDIGYIPNIWKDIWGVSMSDDLHPNATGYEIMANNIFAVMEPYLREQNLLK